MTEEEREKLADAVGQAWIDFGQAVADACRDASEEDVLALSEHFRAKARADSPQGPHAVLAEKLLHTAARMRSFRRARESGAAVFCVFHDCDMRECAKEHEE